MTLYVIIIKYYYRCQLLLVVKEQEKNSDLIAVVGHSLFNILRVIFFPSYDDDKCAINDGYCAGGNGDGSTKAYYSGRIKYNARSSRYNI